MSGLLQCTDGLLQQKAVQSSHYERVEQQLLDRERRQRAALMTLKQRIADVERRGNDVVDLRHGNTQLAEQLAQLSLKLAALQCRGTAAQKTQAAAVERLQDGVRNWSGHSAQIVLVVQALQVQKELSRSARALLRVLRSIARTLWLHRQVCHFYVRCGEVEHWHTTSVEQLSRCLEERIHAATKARKTALHAAASAASESAGPLLAERHRMEWRHGALAAETVLYDTYAQLLQSRCDLAREEVATLSCRVDTEATTLSECEAKLSEATAAATASAKALALQRASHAEVITEVGQHQQQLTTKLAAVKEMAAQTRESVAVLSGAWEAAQRRSCVALCQLLAAGFVSDVCERLRERCTARRAAQASELAEVQEELADLRTRHAKRLWKRQIARAEAAQRQEMDIFLRHEAQLRKSVTDLEGDEWRLLYAQLVRDACHARAAAATAEAARPAAERARLSAVKSVGDGAATVMSAAGGPVQLSKRQRGPAGGRASRTSAASRRQRAALEAVDTLALTASQSSRGAGAGSVVSRRRPSPSSPTTSVTASSHVGRTAYRLVSLNPSLRKRTCASAAHTTTTSPPSQERPPVSKVVKRAHAASAMSPFMAAASESDSSFSLMHDSSATEAGTATTAAAAHTDAVPIARGTAGRQQSPDVRLSSLSLSPSPRCPAGRVRLGATAQGNKENDSSWQQATALPRRAPHTVAIGGRGTAQAAPRNALDTALTTTCTSRSAAGSRASPVTYKLSAASGNASALPTGGRGSGGAGATRIRSCFHPSPRASGGGGVGRHRMPPLLPGAAGAADDLFADVFS